MGTQQLKAEDIIEELNKIPENIRKYVISVALVPFTHPYKEHFISEEEVEDGWAIIGSGDYCKNQITIYAVTLDRPTLKGVLRNELTLCHEIGHIIDGDARAKAKLKTEGRFISHTLRWAMAMCKDNKNKRATTELSSYFVSKYAERTYLLNEDFADSVKFFSDENCRAWLKQNCPSRYRILEDLLGTDLNAALRNCLLELHLGKKFTMMIKETPLKRRTLSGSSFQNIMSMANS